MNIIKKIAISFNVYSLYFVKSFWLNNGAQSEEYKLGSSFTILLVVNFSWIYFIHNQIQYNWKAVIFFVSCYHLLIGLLFNKDILGLVDQYKSLRFKRYYPFFIAYLIVGMILLFIDVFYYS